MKNRHWLEFTEYASIAGVATGAVFSFFAKQALYLSTPLSVALLVGFANRRRVERINEEKTTTSIATLKRKLSKQIKLMDQHIQTLPTPEMVGDVRNSTLRHSRDELKQLTTKIQSMQEIMEQYASILDEQNSGGIRDEIRQLQGFYTEIYGTLKQVQQTFNSLDAENKKKDVENLVTQLRAEAEQLQSRFQSLTDQTQPILSYLQEQVNHLNRQNSAILQQVDANSLKRELDILMDAVADLAPKRELNTVMADVRTLQENQDAQGQAEEAIRKQLQTVMQRLQAVPDVPQFRAQIEETLSWKLSDINQQLRSLPNTEQFQSRIKETLQTELETINLQLETHSDSPPYKLIFDLNPHMEGSGHHPLPLSGSRQILDDALSSTQHRLVMVWPWSVDMQMDKPLMQKLEQFVRQGRQLDIGWCHIASPEEERFLSVINRRWSLDPLHRRSLQRTLQYLLALKRRYSKNFKFRVLGTVENFLVADQSFAVLGIENRLTPISAGKDISLKLWTSDQAVLQQLIQTFEHTDLDPEDIESHWNRAITRYDLGDRAGAMTDINQVLSVNPNYATAYNMRGVIQWDEGDPAAAVTDFDQSLALDETQTTAYCNRGFIRSEQGDQYRAIADFSLAIHAETNRIGITSEPNAKLGIAYFYRGLACQKLDDFEGAIADYSEALKHVEASPVISYHRGITYQALGQYGNAVADLEKTVALFKQQGSQTNTRRASRHLAQAREALAVEASNPPISPTPSPAEPITTDALSSENNSHLPTVGQQSAVSQSVESSSTSPLLDENSAVPAPDERSTISSPDETFEGDTATPSQKSETPPSSAAIPTFLFPDDSRSRPSMIQDMDEAAEVDTETPEPQVDALPTDRQSELSVSMSSSAETERLADVPIELVSPQEQPLATSELVTTDPVSLQEQPLATSEPVTDDPVAPQEQLPASSEAIEPLQSIPPKIRRRRQRADLDKLVTSTLTNFFDEVDMEKLGTQTLDNFFAVVQDPPLTASADQTIRPNDQSQALASSANPSAAEGFEEAFNSSSTAFNPHDGEQTGAIAGPTSSNGSHHSNPLNHHPETVKANAQAQQSTENDPDIEKLVTSTLTNFFKDISPDALNGPSPDFFEEVSNQDISEETLFNFHRVMDDVPASTDARSRRQEEQQGSMGEDLISEQASSVDQESEGQPLASQDNGVTDNWSALDMNTQPPLSMNHFFEETASEPVGEGTLINFQHVVQDYSPESPNVARGREKDSGEDAQTAPDSGMGHLSENDVESIITPGTTDFLEAFDTEEAGTQTLGDFMTAFQDAFTLDEAGVEVTDDINEAVLTSSKDSPSPSVHTEESAVKRVNEHLSQAQAVPFQESDLKGTADPETGDESGMLDVESPKPSQGPPRATHKPSNQRIESNGLSVGTETMSNLMAAIAAEDLGTQTLQDFVAIMGAEKAKTYETTQSTPLTMNGERAEASEGLNEPINPFESDLTEEADALEATNPVKEISEGAEIEPETVETPDEETLGSVQLNDDRVVNPEEDSILFESLADFSDRF